MSRRKRVSKSKSSTPSGLVLVVLGILAVIFAQNYFDVKPVGASLIDIDDGEGSMFGATVTADGLTYYGTEGISTTQGSDYSPMMITKQQEMCWDETLYTTYYAMPNGAGSAYASTEAYMYDTYLSKGVTCEMRNVMVKADGSIINGNWHTLNSVAIMGVQAYSSGQRYIQNFDLGHYTQKVEMRCSGVTKTVDKIEFEIYDCGAYGDLQAECDAQDTSYCYGERLRIKDYTYKEYVGCVLEETFVANTECYTIYHASDDPAEEPASVTPPAEEPVTITPPEEPAIVTPPEPTDIVSVVNIEVMTKDGDTTVAFGDTVRIVAEVEVYQSGTYLFEGALVRPKTPTASIISQNFCHFDDPNELDYVSEWREVEAGKKYTLEFEPTAITLGIVTPTVSVHSKCYPDAITLSSLQSDVKLEVVKGDAPVPPPAPPTENKTLMYAGIAMIILGLIMKSRERSSGTSYYARRRRY